MNQSVIAPVVLLAYRRPTLTRQVFETIKAAKPPILLIVMDGPKPGNPEDQRLVSETRNVVEVVDWDCEVHRIYADHNLGLKNRISTGLDEVFQRVDRAIILEDDCLPSPSFFRYASEMLEKFARDERIGIVSGSQRLRGRKVSTSSYDFSQDVRIWGWATWARTWHGFQEFDGLNRKRSSAEVRDLVSRFSRGARRNHMKSMVSHENNLDSWALPFTLHSVEKGYLNVVPSSNLVKNIGLGVSSTHTGFESYVAEVAATDLDFPLVHPSEVKYGGFFDELESQLDLRELFLYPLRHPFDTAGRFMRYGIRRLRSWKARRGTVD